MTTTTAAAQLDHLFSGDENLSYFVGETERLGSASQRLRDLLFKT